MPMPRVLTLAAFLAATIWLSPGALAQAPSDEEFGQFVEVFVALQENARGLRRGGADAAPHERRDSREIVEEHGWELERYNRMAYQVNSTPALMQRLRVALEERGCAGLLRDPVAPCE